MKRYVIFGAGNLGSVLANELSESNEIVGFLDNNEQKWGTEVNGFPVLGNASVLEKLEYDEIVIASTMRYDEIRKSIMDYGVAEDKFNRTIQQRLMTETLARVNFLRDFTKLVPNDNSLCVAEGGVFQGMFAAEINKYFPQNKLYLFDTFEGFDAKDIAVELENSYSNVRENYYNETSVELVLSRLPHRETAIVKKGYFPDTIEGMPEEKFIFVNLDFDLYTPILAGLEYFYPRLEEKGVILVHDYFTEFYHGVSNAVSKYEEMLGRELKKMPIGDGISLAIFKS